MPKYKKKSFTYKMNYYDSDGKRRGKTFTAPTLKEARMMAFEWELNQQEASNAPKLTVLNAVDRYIQAKEKNLSPSTVASYKETRETHIVGTRISPMDAYKVEDIDLQLWISDLTAANLSVKTIKNCYSLVRSSLRMFVKKDYFVTIGQEQPKELYCPSSEDVKTVLAWIREHERYDLERAVLLSAIGTLRRGEICALTDKDIIGNQIIVNKAVVRTEEGTWELKPPKTKSSNRIVEMPESVMAKFKGVRGKIVSYTPHSLGEAFRHAVREAGVHPFRFHDLRHYSASIMNYQGISDKTIQKRGGWASNYVMKRVYQNEIDVETKRETDAINVFFSEQFS